MARKNLAYYFVWYKDFWQKSHLKFKLRKITEKTEMSEIIIVTIETVGSWITSDRV